MIEKDMLAAIGLSQSALVYFNDALGTVTSESLFFRYRMGQECPFPVVRYVVSSNNLCWTFGQKNPALVSKVIVCTSPLEAVCWFHFCHMSFRNTDQLLFLAVGDVPGLHFYELARGVLKFKKISLVLGGDFLGRICDIRVATRIMDRECCIKLIPADRVSIMYRGSEYFFDEQKLTLNSFETVCGMRSGIRTYKPKVNSTFFRQLAGGY